MVFTKLLKTTFYPIVFLILIFTTAINISINHLYTPGPLKDKTIVLLQPGLSANEISIILVEAGIIKNPAIFSIISRLYTLFKPLKSGEYDFTYGISPLQIIRKLAAGKSIIHRLVIPEGSTVHEIIEKINKEPLLSGTISLPIPEGYLMPSTYFYSYGDKRENIFDKMRLEMTSALNEVMLKLPVNSPLKSRKDVLILASIIEKETNNDTERPKVAAVFINRLRKNMKLQACPTVAYALTEGKYRLTRPLTRNDLKVNSPYNTYQKLGLPPGAISCPGKKSLEAAVNTAPIDSLYFIVDGNGGHHFSKTFDQHNQHKANLKHRSK
ncbi:MAG: endolytic transglycosylase MltG [Alphaproteobacteria bacterium]|nr:endolytic transglycosylase MltG [Alphaproteobacteria bacterium]